MEPAAFFSLPLWRDYTFQIVLAGTTILGVLCGVVGSFIVLRREALLGDGISLGIAPDKSRDPVLFRAAVALPD